MLKSYNYANRGFKIGESKFDSNDNNDYVSTRDEFTEKSVKTPTNSGSDNMDNLDLFLTLLLKNLTQKERMFLLNKLLNTDWEKDDLESHLAEIINKKKSDDELKKSLDYEYFLWDFNNWKNYFLEGESEK